MGSTSTQQWHLLPRGDHQELESPLIQEFAFLKPVVGVAEHDPFGNGLFGDLPSIAWLFSLARLLDEIVFRLPKASLPCLN